MLPWVMHAFVCVFVPGVLHLTQAGANKIAPFILLSGLHVFVCLFVFLHFKFCISHRLVSFKWLPRPLPGRLSLAGVQPVLPPPPPPQAAPTHSAYLFAFLHFVFLDFKFCISHRPNLCWLATRPALAPSSQSSTYACAIE